jgi:Virulence-associated protein E
MTSTNEEYSEYIDTLIETLQRRDETPDIDLCVTGLEAGRDNRKIRDYAIGTLKHKAADFDKALKRTSIKDRLGTCPNNPREFVEKIASEMGLAVTYKGLMSRDEIPYVLNDHGKKGYFSPDTKLVGTLQNFARVNFQGNVNFDDFVLRVRTDAVEIGLPFKPAELNDAAKLWYSKACQDRLWRLMDDLSVSPSYAQRLAQDALLRLADTCFDCPHGSAFVVAVLNKFIWQVKRKMHGLPIFDHLMPIILGKQGTGKSTLIRMLLDPIEEAWVPSDFKMITDDRNISLWKNFVIFMDEMGWAKKSDMDVVKNVITAESLNRRVFHTTISQEVAQNATFIGAANAGELSDILRDVTGTRRFVSLDMKDQPDRDVINSIDWLAVWQSVDESAEDPTIPFKAILSKVQEADRTKTPVEEWLDVLTRSELGHADNGKLRPTYLHLSFRQFEKDHFPAIHGTSIHAFGRELRRHASKMTCKLRFVVESASTVYYWR